MAQFNYIAQPRGGDRTSGELEADDLQSAARQLRNQGLMILNLQEAGAVVITEVDEQTEHVEAKSPAPMLAALVQVIERNSGLALIHRELFGRVLRLSK